MDFAQGRELWNTIAQKKNLSIHHGIKVIKGWCVIPEIRSDVDSLRVITHFLREWADSIDNEVQRIESIEKKKAQAKAAEPEYLNGRIMCSCNEHILEEDEIISKDDDPDVYEGLQNRCIAECAVCGGIKVEEWS